MKPSVSESYTNATPTSIAVGGIAKGTTFENKSMSDMFNALLYPYVAPSNLVLNASEMNGVFENGTTVTLNSVSWSFSKNSGTPIRVWCPIWLRLSDMGIGSLMMRAFFYDRLVGH